MKLTPEAEKYLGRAYIVTSGGRQAAVTGGSWALLFSNAEDYIDREILDFAHQSNRREGTVDYRVVNGRDFTADRFLPAFGKELEPILQDTTATRTRATYEMVEELLEKHQYAFQGTDITEMLRSGKATPKYDKAGSGISRIVSGRCEATSYLFHVEGKVVNIGGDLLRGVVEAGLKVVLNTEFCRGDSGHEIPALGLIDPEDSGVLGLLMPLSASDITKDKQGRTLHIDPAKACWISAAHAEEMIKSDWSFYDPQVSSIAEDLTIEERVKSRKYGDAVLGIHALQWHGASDEAIKKIVDYASYDAWCSLYLQAIKTVDSLWSEVDIFSSRAETLTTDVVRKITTFSSRTKRICERVESLSKLMEREGGDGALGYGKLPKLVEIVTDLEELCDS